MLRLTSKRLSNADDEDDDDPTLAWFFGSGKETLSIRQGASYGYLLVKSMMS